VMAMTINRVKAICSHPCSINLHNSNVPDQLALRI
jgi:hypothetical protein